MDEEHKKDAIKKHEEEQKKKKEHPKVRTDERAGRLLLVLNPCSCQMAMQTPVFTTLDEILVSKRSRIE